MRVLFTGARAPVTLDLARRFHAEGHTVFLADSLRFGLAATSRMVRRMFVVPGPRTAPVQYIDALLRIINRWKIELLIPTCEEVFYISHFLKRFHGVCRVLTDSIDKLERIHNKWKFSQAPYSQHVRAPESQYLADVGQLEPFLADPAAWVFKPVYSRFASETKIGLTPAEAAALRPSATKPWIAQRRILGQEYSTYSVARAGRVQAHSLYRSAYKVGVGSGIYFMKCDNVLIENFVRDFVAAEEYTGQIGFDFIVDADDRPWVLEANPRATSGAHLFTARDRLVDALVGDVAECVKPTTREPRMLGLAMAIYGIGQAIRQRALWTYVGDCWRGSDVVVDGRDLLPMLLMPLAFAEIVGIALWEGRALTEAATHDIEWNGEPL